MLIINQIIISNFITKYWLMIDVFLLIVTIIAICLSGLVNVYIMAIYCHKDQSNLSPITILSKILIIITLLQVQIQPLMLIFDVINGRTAGPDLTILWVIIFFSILANIGFIKPLISSIYESDQDDACWKRLLWTIAQVFITAAAFGLLLGIGWIIWGKINIPISLVSKGSQSQGIEQINTFTSSVYNMQVSISVPCFLIGLLCLLGYPVLVCCGACGLTALPLSLILQFQNRPKWRRTNEARKITAGLKQQTLNLIKLADQLKRSINRVQYVDGWFARRRKKNEIQTELAEVQRRLDNHRDVFELFQMELKMSDTNPLIFIGKLVLGVICVVASLLLWVQILLSQLVYRGKGKIFLDALLIFFEENNANFMSIAFLMALVTFLTCSMIKGIFFFSNNFPFITIHPMIPGKTWINSFLFQLTLCLLGSCSLLHLLVGTFPQYLRGGEIALMMGMIMDGMYFIGVFIRNKVFIYMYIIMSWVGGVFVMFRLCCIEDFKSDLLKQIEQKRVKMFGKDKKNQPMIEMTEMNINQKPKHNTPSKKKVKLTPM